MIDPEGELHRGLLWVGSATVLARAIELGAALLVLQLLTREALGLAALCVSASLIADSFTSLGVGHALVQARTVSRDELDGAFWLSSGIGLLLAAALAAASPLIGALYGAPALAPMIALGACRLVFAGMAAVPLQRLHRELRFREAGAAQTAASLLEALLKVSLAAAGMGAWSLVLAYVGGGAGLLAAVWLAARFRPRLRFPAQGLRAMARFGLRVTCSNALYNLYRNADSFLVGKLLGIDVLGLYRVALEMAAAPLELVLSILNRVAFPVYARVAAEPSRLLEAFLRSTRTLLLTMGPLLVVLGVLARELLELLAPARWADAAPALQLLCVASLLRGLSMLFPQMFHGAGRPGLAIYDSAVMMALLPAALVSSLLLLGGRLGMVAAPLGWLAAYPPAIGVLLVLSRRVAPLTARAYLRALAAPLLGLLCMGVPMAAARALLSARLEPSLVVVVGSGAAGLGAYLAYLRFSLGMTLRDLVPSRAG